MSPGAEGTARADGAGPKGRERDGSPASEADAAAELGDVKVKPREKSKLKGKVIRVLTVMAYVLSVSLAAIMLSLYYVFLWDPKMASGGAVTHRLQATDHDALVQAPDTLHQGGVQADGLQMHALQAPSPLPPQLRILQSPAPAATVRPDNALQAVDARALQLNTLQPAPVQVGTTEAEMTGAGEVDRAVSPAGAVPAATVDAASTVLEKDSALRSPDVNATGRGVANSTEEALVGEDA